LIGSENNDKKSSIYVASREKISKNKIEIWYDNYDPPKGIQSIDKIKTPKGPKRNKIKKRLVRHNIRNITAIGATPKAASLKNHWGTDKLYNI